MINPLLGGFLECNVDVNGKVTIPKIQRDNANIKNEIIIFGSGKFISIWPQEEYKRYLLTKERWGKEHMQPL